MSNKIKGTVKWFSEEKGFGFIESDGRDYFAHISSIESNDLKTLQKGISVYFNPTNGVKGPQAENITIACSETAIC